MKPEVAEALLGSIEKWEDIVAGTGVDRGGSNCPLCAIFLRLDCEGCPVAASTTRLYCSGTAYEKFHAHCELNHQTWPFSVFDATSQQLAQEELEFLRSLVSATGGSDAATES